MITWQERLERQPYLRDLDAWPPVDTTFLSSRALRLYRHRLDMVRKVLSGDSIRSVARHHRCSAAGISRLMQRCLGTVGDHDPAFKRALIPGKRLKEYRREKDPSKFPSRYGHAGEFQRLLVETDGLSEYLDALLKADMQGKRTAEKLTPSGFQKALSAFLYHKKGFTDSDYPFCVPSAARESIRRYFHQRRKEIMAGRSRKKAERLFSRDLVDYLPYEHSELDEHRMDCMAHAVIYVRESWGERVRLSRLWLVVLIDRGSTAVLSYAFGYGAQPNQDDILQCLVNATTPWQPKELSI